MPAWKGIAWSTMPGPMAAAALVVGFALIVAGFVVWVELVLRDAAVYVAVLFLPLAFAGIVWPATAHWLGRLLRLIVAVILSKLVIVAIVGLGATMLADGAAADGLGPVIVGVGTLLLAGFAPVVLYRIVQVWDVEHTGAFHGALGGAVGRLAAPAVAGAVIASRFLPTTGASTGGAAASPAARVSGTPTAVSAATGGAPPAATPAGLGAGRRGPPASSPAPPSPPPHAGTRARRATTRTAAARPPTRRHLTGPPPERGRAGTRWRRRPPAAPRRRAGPGRTARPAPASPGRCSPHATTRQSRTGSSQPAQRPDRSCGPRRSWTYPAKAAERWLDRIEETRAQAAKVDHYIEARYEDLVRAVDVVVSKPGYGIISDCIANGTALLYTPRGRFAEYDVLVREMPRYLRCACIETEDLLAGRWREGLEAVMAAPPPPAQLRRRVGRHHRQD